jgi:hypothetical protein
VPLRLGLRLSLLLSPGSFGGGGKGDAWEGSDPGKQKATTIDHRSSRLSAEGKCQRATPATLAGLDGGHRRSQDPD